MSGETSPGSSTSNRLLMEEIPQTVDQLNKLIAELFHCMTGPPTAYWDLPLDAVAHGGNCAPVERFVYIYLGWRCPREPTAAVEALLVGRMTEAFIDARRQIMERNKDEIALLFWRRPLTLESYTDHEASGPLTKLTCRLVIPGTDLSYYARQEGAIIPLAL